MRELIERSRIKVAEFFQSKERQEKEQEIKDILVASEERVKGSYFLETTRTVILSPALQGRWDIKGSLERLDNKGEN